MSMINLKKLSFQITSRNLLYAVFIGTIFLMSARPTIDTDLWWHLANGKYITTFLSIPSTDLYSYTAIGHTWIVHEWLSDVFMYGIYSKLGMVGLIITASLILTFTFYLINKLLRQAGVGHNISVLLSIALAIASSFSWGARPQILNFCLLAVLCTLLLRYRTQPGKWVFWIVPLFILWANLHSGYLIGLAICNCSDTPKASSYVTI